MQPADTSLQISTITVCSFWILGVAFACPHAAVKVVSPGAAAGRGFRLSNCTCRGPCRTGTSPHEPTRQTANRQDPKPFSGLRDPFGAPLDAPATPSSGTAPAHPPQCKVTVSAQLIPSACHFSISEAGLICSQSKCSHIPSCLCFFSFFTAAFCSGHW